MPSITTINSERERKKFKKRSYRPWDLEGDAPSPSEQKIDSGTKEKSVASPNSSILLLPPNLIKNWEFHDRPEDELGDITALSNEFKEIGQQQPCIVRPIPNSNKYELIVGERRWRAAKLANLEVKVLARPISDHEAAIIQASENSSREDLSDYARGMSYAKLIDKGILNQKDLIDRLNLSKQQVSRLLSFSKIPKIVIDEIKTFSKISARTAEQIKQLCNKGDEYIQAVTHYADLLREGALGQEKLKTLVEKHIANKDTSKSAAKKLYSRDGRLLFTWRKEKDSYLSVHFPRDITNLIEQKKMNVDSIDGVLKEVIEDALKNI